MELNKSEKIKKLKTIPMAPDESLNSSFTAIPHERSWSETSVPDADVVEAGLEFGEMNESDARESGYTTPKGNAVSSAKPDVKGHPTGAYTDIGEGRSGAVKVTEQSWAPGTWVAILGAAALVGVGALLLTRRH